MTHPIRILTALLLIGLASPGVSPSHAQFGVAAGLNFASFDDIDFGSSSGTVDNSTGYHAGVFYDIGLGVAGIRVGAFYRDIGNVAVTVEGGGNEFLYDVNMFEFPVDVRFNLTATPAVKPYLLAGPVFSFPNSADDAFSEELETLEISGEIGAGIAINAGAIKLFPEFRYGIGVSRFMTDEFDLGGAEFVAERMNSVKLRLGVGF